MNTYNDYISECIKCISNERQNEKRNELTVICTRNERAEEKKKKKKGTTRMQEARDRTKKRERVNRRGIIGHEKEREREREREQSDSRSMCMCVRAEIEPQRRRDINSRRRVGGDRRTVAFALKSADLRLYFLCIKCSGQLAARTGSWRTDHRIRRSGRSRIPTTTDRDSAFSRIAGSRNCTAVFIWCPLLFRVRTYLSIRGQCLSPYRHVRCGKIVENKLVCPPTVPYPSDLSRLSLSLSLSA